MKKFFIALSIFCGHVELNAAPTPEQIAVWASKFPMKPTPPPVPTVPPLPTPLPPITIDPPNPDSLILNSNDSRNVGGQ